jgi:translation initiation factor 1 (eIF-1/SUI1)
MTKKIPTDPPDAPLGHNPFGALQGLRSALLQTAPEAAATRAPFRGPAKEFLEKVVVRYERKGHGGKTVTVVSGVAPAARDTVCAALKKALGCGARVEGDDVIVQGELVERAISWLETRGARNIVRGS